MLAAITVVGLVMLTGCGDQKPEPQDSHSVVMITEYGGITDGTFNQSVYETAKEVCESYNIPFAVEKVTDNTEEGRAAKVQDAIDGGANVLVLPGFTYAGVTEALADENPAVSFLLVDISEDNFSAGYQIPDNVYRVVFQEELAGYMAGYAAVQMGYTHLGFLGGDEAPNAVKRYGYGFFQGCSDAAEEMNIAGSVSVEMAYGTAFVQSDALTKEMDRWYDDGVQVIFSCGGEIYKSIGEAAAAHKGAKIIGVDVDQSEVLDRDYGEGVTLTSATKGLRPFLWSRLAEVFTGNTELIGGQVEHLGLVTVNEIEQNYVQLPIASTQWNDSFTENDYRDLVGKLYRGEITVSNDVNQLPEVAITVNQHGAIV